MRKTTLALTLAFLLAASTAFADHIRFQACTVDNDQVALGIEFIDGTPRAVLVDVDKAFKTVAKVMSTEQLQSREGFIAFISQLSAADKDAIEEFDGAPQVIGTCKASH